MVIVKFKEEHVHVYSQDSSKGSYPKEERIACPPSVETTIIHDVFLLKLATVKIFIYFAVPGIKTAIADHFKVLFRDMPDQTV